MSGVLHVILTHQAAAEVGRMLAWWQQWISWDDILIIHGGDRADFEQVQHPQKLWLSGEKHRREDQQRGAQSYREVYARAGEFLRGGEWEYVFFAEYDHLPVCADFEEKLRERIRMESADVVAFKVRQLERTNHPHWLHPARLPAFAEFWDAMTVRTTPEGRSAVLSMLGTGSFWTREAFLAVSEWEEPFPMYHELFIPTLAHHLGFRVRDLGEQNAWVQHLGRFDGRLDEAVKAGAWTVHPVKRKWLTD